MEETLSQRYGTSGFDAVCCAASKVSPKRMKKSGEPSLWALARKDSGHYETIVCVGQSWHPREIPASLDTRQHGSQETQTFWVSFYLGLLTFW